jgi:hypothetical protein
MKAENLLYMLVIIFAASTLIGTISVTLANSYGQDIDNSFMADVNNISGVQDHLIEPMRDNIKDESSISLVTIGAGIVGAAKLIFNIPAYFVALILSLGGYAPIPPIAATILNTTLWISVVFGILSFIFGRSL